MTTPKLSFHFFFLILFSLVYSSCASKKTFPLTDPDPPVYGVQGISISADLTAVATGGKLQLFSFIDPLYASDTLLTWTSSNTSVATVDRNGLVTGISAGTATITATTNDGGKTASQAIKVIKRYAGEPEQLVGYANYNGTTTGGAGGPTVTVSSVDELANEASSPGPKIIQVSGTLTGAGDSRIWVSSNKTIVGLTGAKLVGLGISIYNVSNVIIRNLAIEYSRVYSNIIIKDGAHHIWIDHCSFKNELNKGDGYYDGLLDIGASAERITNYVTVSWCKFTDADQASLIGSWQRTNDAGSNLTTFHHNLYQRVTERGPKSYQTNTHVFNNYYYTNGSHGGYHGTGMAPTYGSVILAENNYFEDFQGTPMSTNYNVAEEPEGYIIGVQTNFFKNCGPNSITTTAPSWTPPYEYASALTPVADVPALVLTNAGTY